MSKGTVPKLKMRKTLPHLRNFEIQNLHFIPLLLVVSLEQLQRYPKLQYLITQAVADRSPKIVVC